MDLHLESKIKSDVQSRAWVPKILFRDPLKIFNSAGKHLFTAWKTVVGCGEQGKVFSRTEFGKKDKTV